MVIWEEKYYYTHFTKKDSGLYKLNDLPRTIIAKQMVEHGSNSF